jgi:hypothetical protein
VEQNWAGWNRLETRVNVQDSFIYTVGWAEWCHYGDMSEAGCCGLCVIERKEWSEQEKNKVCALKPEVRETRLNQSKGE